MASSKVPRRTASLISSTFTDHSYHFPVWVPDEAVRLAGLAEIFAGAIVGAPHQVNLGERVEDGAGGDVELHRLPDFERPHQDVFGAVQIPICTNTCPRVASVTARPWPSPRAR